MTRGEYFETSRISGHVGTEVDAGLALTVERAVATEIDRMDGPASLSLQ